MRTLPIADARTAAATQAPGWVSSPVSEIWRWLTSVRLALILILLIALATLAGTLIDQAPGAVRADPASYDRWLDGARDRYGSWTTVMERLHLFRVFSSVWFQTLIALLTVNIIVCTLNRWSGIYIAVFRPRVRMSQAFFQRARTSAAFSVDLAVPGAAAALRQGLRQAGYRTVADNGESVAVYADRFRFMRFGTLISHLSIVLLLLGVIMGRLWGWQDGQFVVAEGSTRALPLAPDISVMLDEFQDEYYVDGPPKDFASRIVIYKDGREVKRATVRVNSPASYGGIAFNQAFFGQAAVVEVTDASGKTLFNEGVPLAWTSRSAGSARPLGFFDVPEKAVTAYVVGPEPGVYDTVVPQGTVRLELYDSATDQLIGIESLSRNEAVTMEGLTFRFLRERPFTGLKVVKDPGVNVVWVASGLMVLGLVMVFWFPHRRFWALCSPRDDGGADIRLAATSQRDIGLEKDFEQVTLKVRRALARRQLAERNDSHV